MPNNKEALKRYRIIHSILRRGGKHKSSRITEICNEAGIPVKIRTIQKDLSDLAEDTELEMFLPIKQDKKTKTYYYEKIPENIFPSIELEKEEVKALLFYAKTIRQYKEYPIFSEISNAVKKVIENSNIAPKTKELFEMETLLETENHHHIDGAELIADILDAITKKRIINVEYRKFDGNAKTHKIKPILLKEDKQMWYVLGVNIKHDKLITFALDRIVDITITNEEFDDIKFDSIEYFKYSFGITVSEDDPIDVIISFTPYQGNYLRTLPIHNTQEIIEDNDEKFVIKVTVKPSYEFYSKIFSYGFDATIISPKPIRERVFKTFEKAISKYKLS
jgi:predicted DNA-binding transcriptional regulator YafY